MMMIIMIKIIITITCPFGRTTRMHCGGTDYSSIVIIMIILMSNNDDGVPLRQDREDALPRSNDYP